MNPRSRMTLLVLLGILSIALGSRKIAAQHDRVRLGYELSEAQRELRMLQEENRRLRLEYSVLISPDRIKTLATALGMRRPMPGQIRTTSSASTERDRTRGEGE